MTGSDTHADTIREALHHGLEYWGHELDDVTGAVHALTYEAKTYESGMDSLDALVADLEREREAAANIKRDYDDVFGQLLRSHGELSRERARADRAEAALRDIEERARKGKIQVEGVTVDKPVWLCPNIAIHHLSGIRQAARAALSAGSGGREP